MGGPMTEDEQEDQRLAQERLEAELAFREALLEVLGNIASALEGIADKMKGEG